MSDHDYDDDKTAGTDDEATSDFGSADDPMSGYNPEDVVDEPFLIDNFINGLLDYTIDLNISRDSGIDMSFSVKSSSTVEDLIRSVERESYDDFDVEYNGRLLPRDMTLRDAYIPKNGRVKTVERKIKIQVKDGNGRKNAVDILRSATIKDLKEKLHNSNQITGDNIRISYNGSELSDSQTLRYYNIQKNSELFASTRCYGG